MVVPLYNKAEYIERAVRSILNQTYTDLEAVIVDDGSSDESAAIVEAIQDPRIRLIRQANAGEGAARNRGIRESRADIVAFLDADDEYRSGFLAAMHNALERHPDCVAAFSGIANDPTDESIAPGKPGANDFFEFVNAFRPLGSGPSASSIAIRKEALNQAGGFAENLRVGSDTDTWVRLARLGPFAFVPERLAVYYLDIAGSAMTVGAGLPKEYPRAAETIEGWRKDGDISKAAAIYHDSLVRHYAYSCLRRNQGAMARQVLARQIDSDHPRSRRLQLASYLPHAVREILLARRES